MTVTEALGEIKTISARIGKKREAIMRYFARDGRLRDPLEADGGSAEYVRRERQAVADLEERVVTIRSAIQSVNLATGLTVGGKTRSVAAWLNWRRDVSSGAKGFLSQMANQLNNIRQQAPRQGQTVSEKDTGSPNEIVVAVKEMDLAREVEEAEAVLGSLDGKLSLINATTMIEV